MDDLETIRFIIKRIVCRYKVRKKRVFERDAKRSMLNVIRLYSVYSSIMEFIHREFLASNRTNGRFASCFQSLVPAFLLHFPFFIKQDTRERSTKAN